MRHYDDLSRGTFQNEQKAKQLVSFEGMLFNGRNGVKNVTPTDIDGFIQLDRENCFIFFELKYSGDAPEGQISALEKAATAIQDGGRECAVFIAVHNTPHTKTVKARDATVIKTFYSGKWYREPKGRTLQEMIERFIDYINREENDMSLPKYTRRERKPARPQLPKDAYVVEIQNARLRNRDDGSEYIEIAFDISEGAYAGFYMTQFNDAKKNGEDAVWPYDARFNLNVPNDKSKNWEWNMYNEFFTQLEDSNNGYIFSGNPASLKGKIFGGKFRIKQTKKNGHVYNNTQLWWTCDVEEVRSGKARENLPADKLVAPDPSPAPAPTTVDGFVNVASGSDVEIPWD